VAANDKTRRKTEAAASGGARPTIRGRVTEDAIQQAARQVIARKGFLKMTIADIASEAGRSTASFYNYYDSKEDLLGHWASQFQQEAHERALVAYRHGVPRREVIHQSVQAHWQTYKEHLAEMVGVFQVAMINDEFAAQWRELRRIAVESIAEGVQRAQAEGYCPGLDPVLAASAIVAMLNQFCFVWLAQDGEAVEVEFDEAAAVETLTEVWYRTIYWKPGDDATKAVRRRAKPSAAKG